MRPPLSRRPGRLAAAVLGAGLLLGACGGASGTGVAPSAASSVPSSSGSSSGSSGSGGASGTASAATSGTPGPSLPAQAAAVVDEVEAAVARSRAAADGGVLVVRGQGEYFDTSDPAPTGPGVVRTRFDGTRTAERTAAGHRRVLTPSEVYLLVPSTADRRTKARLGVPAGAFVVHRGGASWQDPARHVDLLFDALRPGLESTPDTLRARAGPGPDGRTTLELSFDPVRLTWTLDDAGRIVAHGALVDDTVTSWAITYAPQTVAVPGATVDGDRYDAARAALDLPPLVVDPAQPP